MDSATLWPEVVKVALLGSDRQPLTLPPAPTPSPLTRLLAQLESSDPARYILQVAAILALHQRASLWPAVQSLPEPKPCRLDDLPDCSPLAQRLLSTILDESEHRESLAEWLALAQRAQCRVPEELLPRLLNLGSPQVKLQPAIRAVLGQRGQWLAAQNPAWAYGLVPTQGEPDLELWQTGDHATRLAVLQQLRAHSPQAARTEASKTWKTEKAEARAAFLALFAQNLSMEDEPWLETLLDDRSKQVRQGAAELLAKLPESRFYHRMVQRVVPLLTLTSENRLVIVLPEALTPEMERDGIQTKFPNHGEKAGWLVQMLGVIHPNDWCARWHTTATDLIKALPDQWQELFLEGWAIATRLHCNQSWAEALLTTDLTLLPSSQNNNPIRLEPLETLAAVLPPDRQQALSLQILTSSPDPFLKHPRLLFSLLNQGQHPWSTELSQAVIQHLCHLLEKHTPEQLYGGKWKYASKFQQSLPHFAQFVSPSQLEAIAPPLLAAIKKYPVYWQSSANQFLTRLEFRRHLHQAFQET